MPTATGTVPIPQIKLSGAPWPIDELVELRIARGLGTASSAHLRIDDSADASSKFAIDGDIEIAVDVFGSALTVFTGKIVALGVEFGRGRIECLVDAYDASYKLGRQTVIKTHLKKTAADIVREIAREAGLTAEIGGDLDKFSFDSIQQRGTPLRFVTALCHAAGCEWYVEGTKLIVKARDDQPPTVAFEGDESLHRFTARYSAADEVSEVTTRGWDLRQKRAIVGTASGSSTKTASTAPVTNRSPQGTVKATSWPRNVVTTQGDADAAAAAMARRMGAAALTARGEGVIAPAIMPGRFVSIENVNPTWNGNYYVTEVEHVFGERQPFATRFTVGPLEQESLVELLGMADRSSASRFTDGVTIGLVTNNKDDTGLNRVKLKLPYLSDNDETDWARVAQPGAGNNRGWLTLPEVNDEVLVAFEHGDIRRPYVIGGLWNDKDRPPVASTSELLRTDGGVVQRSFTTRKGHKLTFVDEGSAGASVSIALGTKKVELKLSDTEILVSHKDGGEITIANEQASIVLDKNGGITLKGQKVTIEAQQDLAMKGLNVKAESQASMNVKAGTTLELKSTAPAKLESSAIMEIKGALVKIN